MAQIIVYKARFDLEDYKKFTVECNSLEKVLEYLQESAMLIIDSACIEVKELKFLKLLKLSFPYCSIVDLNVDSDSVAFEKCDYKDLSDILKLQLKKTFKKVNKKRLLISLFNEL